ncbi:hypothetical protein HAV15_001997 [Penicillium sp. str. |nr:hypothetical protein HAV15_001997 [Penicillium sp. str. \
MKLEQEHSEIGCSEDTYAQTKLPLLEDLFKKPGAERNSDATPGRQLSIFKDLKLEDWVKHAMGMPSAAIGLFESYHNELGLSLFCFLQQFPSDIDIFWEATSQSNKMTHFYTVPSRALTAFENKRPYHKLPIEAGLIVGPLKVLLARPDKAIIRRLKVLEARYTRYKVGPDMASGRI